MMAAHVRRSFTAVGILLASSAFVLSAQDAAELKPNTFVVSIRGSKAFAEPRSFDAPSAIARMRYRPGRPAENAVRKGWAVAEFDLVMSHRPLSCSDGLGPTKFLPLQAEEAVYAGFGTLIPYDPQKSPSKGSLVVTIGETLLSAPAAMQLSRYPVWLSHPAVPQNERLASTGRGYQFAVTQRDGKLFAQLVVRQKSIELTVDAPLTLCPVVNEVS